MTKTKTVRHKKKAVFLDRDGVVIREVDHLCRVEQLRILPRAAEAIKEIGNLGYVAVLITNQAAIAKGMLTEKGLESIHAVLVGRLTRRGAKLDGNYYCPHHPEGKISRYRVVCSCRKPEAGLTLLAAKEMNLDLERSFTIGDKTGDILSGRNAGTKTILVQTGYGGKDGLYGVKPDYVAKNLADAVRIIKKYA